MSFTITKTTLSLIFTSLFFLASIFDLVGIVFEIQGLQNWCKPLLMISLLSMYLSSSPRINWVYATALIFSFFGDVFLLDKTNLFLAGVASFLVTQLLYILIFKKSLPSYDRKQLFSALIPFIIYLTVLMWILIPRLGSLLLPVLIYGITISLFGTVALLNYLLRRDKNSKILLAGAVLFIISDSMIAMGKFNEPLFWYPVAIMLTYIMAQYLIYKHVIKTETESLVKNSN